MKLSDLISALSASPLNIADGGKEIKGGYAGDFLSFVMGKAPEDCAWFTVMNNRNVAAVALLAGVGAVVLCENVKADDALKLRAAEENINILETKLDIFSAIKEYLKHAD